MVFAWGGVGGAPKKGLLSKIKSPTSYFLGDFFHAKAPPFFENYLLL